MSKKITVGLFISQDNVVRLKMAQIPSAGEFVSCKEGKFYVNKVIHTPQEKLVQAIVCVEAV